MASLVTSTARQLSADLDVTTSRISEIVNGKRAISAETALRLGLFFNMEPRFWLNLQAEYDMRVAEHELLEHIAPRIRAFVPAGGLRAWPSARRGSGHEGAHLGHGRNAHTPVAGSRCCSSPFLGLNFSYAHSCFEKPAVLLDATQSW
jgi:addiction module HigA family antidote